MKFFWSYSSLTPHRIYVFIIWKRNSISNSLASFLGTILGWDFRDPTWSSIGIVDFTLTYNGTLIGFYAFNSNTGNGGWVEELGQVPAQPIAAPAVLAPFDRFGWSMVTTMSNELIVSAPGYPCTFSFVSEV